MPRRTWLDDRVDTLVKELGASSMHLDRQRAGELITDRVHAVAAHMGVTEQTARRYFDDETVTDMARRRLFELVDEQPGADVMEAPRTVPLPLARVGITVAALAEAMQVRAANESSDRVGDVVTTYGQTLSGLGQVTAEAGSGRAALRRRSRSRRRCCAGRPGTSPTAPTWPPMVATSRTAFPRQPAASSPRPFAATPKY